MLDACQEGDYICRRRATIVSDVQFQQKSILIYFRFRTKALRFQFQPWIYRDFSLRFNSNSTGPENPWISNLSSDSGIGIAHYCTTFDVWGHLHLLVFMVGSCATLSVCPPPSWQNIHVDLWVDTRHTIFSPTEALGTKGLLFSPLNAAKVSLKKFVVWVTSCTWEEHVMKCSK